jgi:transposase-like protein
MTTCYGALVEKTRRRYRKLTDAERERVLSDRQRRRAAVQEEKDSLKACHATWIELYEQGVSPTSIADAVGVHPTQVQKVCTPSPNYRATRERKS